MKACFNNRNLKFILYINANIRLFILSYSINESNCIYSYSLTITKVPRHFLL